jgi:fatty acid desaturase
MTTTPTGLIPRPELAQLNALRDGPALVRFASHLLLIGAGGWLGSQASLPWALRGAGLLASGIGLATCFAPMHECGHRTAFANRQLNDACAWIAGLLSFYNATFYRRYHQWHHRFAHQSGLDPELEDPQPTTLLAYGLELVGWNWWIGKLRGHARLLFGDLSGIAYLSPEVVPQVRRSVRLQFAVYGLVILASLALGHGWFLLWAWLLPLALGQPLLRFVLLAEHSGCDFSADGTRNTRTTLTNPLVCWLMWNMPFHAEHHLYASLPFHALPKAHRWIGPKIQHCDRGYLAVHRQLLTNLSALALPT